MSKKVQVNIGDPNIEQLRELKVLHGQRTVDVKLITICDKARRELEQHLAVVCKEALDHLAAHEKVMTRDEVMAAIRKKVGDEESKLTMNKLAEAYNKLK